MFASGTEVPAIVPRLFRLACEVSGCNRKGVLPPLRLIYGAFCFWAGMLWKVLLGNVKNYIAMKINSKLKMT
jgi:hypothetical protein